MRSLAISTSAARRLRLPAALLSTAATILLLSLLPTPTAQAAAPAVTLPPASEVEALLGQTPLGSLTAGKLAEALSHVEGLEGLETAALEEAIEKVLAELSGKGATLEELLKGSEGAAKLEETLKELLGPLGSKLEEALGGNPQQKLEEALSSTPVGELIGKLLEGSPEPQAVLAQILEALGPERLQNLVGSALSGEPFSAETFEELAQKLGTTVQALGAQFGKSAEQLPATATTMTAPLKNGDTLAAVKAAEGITLGVIKSTGETVGGTGGTGAPGAPGANGTTAPAPAATAKRSGKLRLGKLRLLSHKVKGKAATIVLQVPSAGRLSARGNGIRQISRETSQAERVTIHPSLTKAGTAAVRKHHRGYKVPLKVTFKPVGGAATTVSVPLTYR